MSLEVLNDIDSLGASLDSKIALMVQVLVSLKEQSSETVGTISKIIHQLTEDTRKLAQIKSRIDPSEDEESQLLPSGTHNLSYEMPLQQKTLGFRTQLNFVNEDGKSEQTYTSRREAWNEGKQNVNEYLGVYAPAVMYSTKDNKGMQGPHFSTHHDTFQTKPQVVRQIQYHPLLNNQCLIQQPQQAKHYSTTMPYDDEDTVSGYDRSNGKDLTSRSQRSKSGGRNRHATQFVVVEENTNSNSQTVSTPSL